MSMNIPDPLSFVASEAGLAATTRNAQTADGYKDFTTPLRAAQMGEPIPIVFCRRRTISGVTHGGVIIEPRATEVRLTSTGVDLDYAWLLILSEGELPLVQGRDIFQATCRDGDTFNQKYEGRAGTWAPGNTLSALNQVNARAPRYVGTGGSYENLTTLSYEGSLSLISTDYKRQIFVFIREGMQVTRLLDDTYGPSDNFADLANYLLSQASLLNSDLIDTQGLTDAAQFTDTNRFFYNGTLTQSGSIFNWLQRTASDFLLRFSLEGGKFTLRPCLQVNSDGSIDTGVITPEYTFTEEHVLPEGFEIQYLESENRLPFCAVVLWRQQTEDVGIFRSVNVRYNDEAPDGPFVQYDLTSFCTTEDHAVKVGVYNLARRKLITHNLRITVRAGNYSEFLSLGDIVRVRLRRETELGKVSYHDRMYEIERIGKQSDGRIVYTLTHFPIDNQGRSLIGRAVANASGTGTLLESQESTYTCDVNAGDTGTVGTSFSYDYSSVINGSAPSYVPTPSNYEFNLPRNQLEYNPPLNPSDPPNNNPSDEGPPPSDPDNPDDPIEADLEGTVTITGYSGTKPAVGDTLSTDQACAGGRVLWYLEDINTGARTFAGSGPFSVTNATVSQPVRIVGISSCPDPGSPDGYGPGIETNKLDFFDPNAGTIACAGSGFTNLGPGSNPPGELDGRSYPVIGNAFPAIRYLRYYIGFEPYWDSTTVVISFWNGSAWVEGFRHLMTYHPGDYAAGTGGATAQYVAFARPYWAQGSNIVMSTYRTSEESFYSVNMRCSPPP